MAFFLFLHETAISIDIFSQFLWYSAFEFYAIQAYKTNRHRSPDDAIPSEVCAESNNSENKAMHLVQRIECVEYHYSYYNMDAACDFVWYLCVSSFFE